MHWFCTPCHAVIKNTLSDDRVAQVLLKLTEQLSHIEEKLDSKVDATKFPVSENMVKVLHGHQNE